MKTPSERRIKADLDALQVFDAVMAEQNMTRAALRLSMTPSAVSHAMSRLRVSVKDELFVRTATGVRPTKRAIELWATVGDAIRTLQTAVGRDSFRPETTRFEIRISMNDMFTEILGPHLYQLFADAAPNAEVSFRQRRQIENDARLQTGMLDFSLGAAPTKQPDLRYLPFWEARYQCVYRRGHPAEKRLGRSMKEILAWPHVTAMPDGETQASADLALHDLGYAPRGRVSVGTFSAVPAIVCASDCIALLPTTYIQHMRAQYPALSVCALPMKLKPLSYFLAWHERSERIRPKAWTLALLKAFIQGPEARNLLSNASGSSRAA